MARTKQTARKSTGGRAPRKSLPTGNEPRFYDYGKCISQQQILSEIPKIVDEGPPTTSQENNSNAQTEALASPDILVIILSQLPHSCLLQAKRVNKTWASVFTHVEVQAALFRQPRPKGSALYVERYSDILTDRFSASFWPTAEEDRAYFSSCPAQKTFHPMEGSEPLHTILDHDDQSEKQVESTTPLQLEEEERHNNICPYSQQWRELLVCQPPINVLELVVRIDVRGSGIVEYRTIIHRPTGIRMGFLYDAVRHWHEFQRCPYTFLLWDRRTGEGINGDPFIENGSSSMTGNNQPCITLEGRRGYGCRASPGPTYEWYPNRPKPQVIESGDEEVKYQMSRPLQYR